MKVPDEMVEAAYEAGWEEDAEILDSVNETRIRKALEAVLPKVRGRLLSEETNRAVRERWFDAAAEFGGNDRLVALALVEAAFDHAFPEEEP